MRIETDQRAQRHIRVVRLGQKTSKPAEVERADAHLESRRLIPVALSDERCASEDVVLLAKDGEVILGDRFPCADERNDLRVDAKMRFDRALQSDRRAIASGQKTAVGEQRAIALIEIRAFDRNEF